MTTRKTDDATHDHRAEALRNYSDARAWVQAIQKQMSGPMPADDALEWFRVLAKADEGARGWAELLARLDGFYGRDSGSGEGRDDRPARSS